MKKTRAIKDHWNAVAELGCIVCGRPAEIAHCHNGSISDELPPRFHPGMGQKQNHYLVLPLCPEHHRIGPDSLDGGNVRDWEIKHGTQIDLLNAVGRCLDCCVFEKANAARNRY